MKRIAVHFKMLKSRPSVRKNAKGMAMIETLPILIIFIVLLGYGLGFFGMVHTGIMNSMAARTYAFETFRNRSDVRLFRDDYSDDELFHYEKIGNRVHAISSEKAVGGGLGEGQFASTRPLAFGRRLPASAADALDHNDNIYDIVGRNRQGGVEVSPGWVMISYGICINATCGD